MPVSPRSSSMMLTKNTAKPTRPEPHRFLRNTLPNANQARCTAQRAFSFATKGEPVYPTYQAWRNGGKIIQKFKQSGNGVLFAAGSCWEGIDFPGDMVSLLIIAKLPFPIPDPVSNYERRQYPNLRDYINAEIIPEMQKKLRQGFGRAIRTEQDSCVVAILDERAGIGGKYHDAALAALPTCPIIEKIEDVQQFIREQKRPDYFL